MTPDRPGRLPRLLTPRAAAPNTSRESCRTGDSAMSSMIGKGSPIPRASTSIAAYGGIETTLRLAVGSNGAESQSIAPLIQ